MKVYPQNVVISMNDNIVYREEKICRICYEEEETESKLLTPCACTGTMGYIHEHCLKKWIETKKKSVSNYRCELCNKKLFLKKMYKEEKLVLPGLHKYYYSYMFDILVYVVLNYSLSFFIYSIDKSNNYLFVDTLDICENKYLLKIIKKELPIGETGYSFLFLSFSSFILSMFYYFISLIYLFCNVYRKKTFLKINCQNLLGCIFISSSSFFLFYVVYILFCSISAAEVFIYTSGPLSFLNWPLMKFYCYNYNEYVNLMNNKYNKIEILNVTFNPLEIQRQRQGQIQVDL